MEKLFDMKAAKEDAQKLRARAKVYSEKAWRPKNASKHTVKFIIYYAWMEGYKAAKKDAVV